MWLKVYAVASVVFLPLCLITWQRSHRSPQHRRFDLTLYKSMEIRVKDGVCGLSILSMPTKTASKSELRTILTRPVTIDDRSLYFSSQKHGPYRTTRAAFPLWFPTLLATLGVTAPIVSGPVRRWHRRRRGRCEQCGYLLRGTLSRRCPECGARVR